MGTGLESKRWPLTELPCGGGFYAQNFPAIREGCSILQLWAGAAFSARNGDTEGLLSEAARTGLHLTDIFPAPGGFTAAQGEPPGFLLFHTRSLPAGQNCAPYHIYMEPEGVCDGDRALPQGAHL